MRTPTRRLSFLLLILLAGCGGESAAPPPPQPKIQRATAEQLAARSDAIADALDAGDVCTAAVRADELQDAVIEAINAGAVPPALQEELQSRANELVNTVNCPPPPAETETDEEEDEDDGKGKGKGKGKGNSDEEENPLTVTEEAPVP